jgi:hypothetical protein
MDDVGFEAYYIGTLDYDNQWQLEDTLEGHGIELSGLTYASQWDAAAAHLSYLVSEEDLEGIHGETDSSGQMHLDNLKDGMYLVVQEDGESYGDISPFLVSVPYKEDDEWTESVTVYPKASYTPEEDKGKIVVTKRAGYLDTQLMEVEQLIPEDATYYVGLFLDDQGTVPYGANYVKPIEMKGYSVGTAEFDGLPPKTYYVFETDEYGNAIQLEDLQEEDSVRWYCELYEDSSQEIKLTSGEGETDLINVYYDFPEGFSIRGGVEITKEVMQSGNEVTVDDTFYAGVFLDEAGEELITLVQLKQNDMVFTELPLGGEDGTDPITYYIYETDQDGIRVDKDGFAYTVTGESSIDIRKGASTGEVTIVNTLPPEATPEPRDQEEPETTPVPTVTPTKAPTVTRAATPAATKTPSGSSPSSSSGTSGQASSVRTGDESPITAYLCLAAAAVFAGILVMYSKRRKR